MSEEIKENQKKIGVIMFMGPPGSGKGTQARFVQEEFGFERIETGAILRSMRDLDTPVAKLVTKLIDAGALAPPPVVADLVISRTKEILEHGHGVVFDGSPRTLFEAEKLVRALVNGYEEKIVVIFLDVPIKEAGSRLDIRLVCSKCNTPADLSHKKCPRCGGELKKRVDDDADARQKRWNEYHFRTLPTIKYLEKLGLVARVDGNRPIQEIAVDVKREIEKKLKR